MEEIKRDLKHIQEKNENTAKKLDKSVVRLTRALDIAYNHPGVLFWRGIIKGIGQGLGATVGVAIVLFFISWILRVLGGIPALDQWVNSLNRSLPY